MTAPRGAALLNAVLLIITFALLTSLMTNFLWVGLQGVGVQVQASQAYYLAVSGASCMDGNGCNAPLVLTFGDLGQATLEVNQVTARVGDNKRILKKNGALWQEVAN